MAWIYVGAFDLQISAVHKFLLAKPRNLDQGVVLLSSLVPLKVIKGMGNAG